jgi:uncharacterized membrane protein YdfJ with MMPL/SSD domain
MQTAGRSVLFSGATVAIGLALLLFVPVPFVRSLGFGGFLVPLASMLATVTLQPALLSVLGVRGMRRIELLPAARNIDHGFWSRLARAIMRHPVRFLLVGAAILLAAAIPAVFLKVTPGSISALPPGNDSVRGIQLLRDRVGAGALTPTEIVIDTGQGAGTRTPNVQTPETTCESAEIARQRTVYAPSFSGRTSATTLRPSVRDDDANCLPTPFITLIEPGSTLTSWSKWSAIRVGPCCSSVPNFGVV